jgi:hypothetical protein
LPENQSPSPLSHLDRDTIQFEKLSQGIFSINYKVDSSKMKYTKEQILRFLESENRNALRDVSRYFYNVSGEYRRIVHHYMNLLTFDYLVIPRTNGEKFDSAFQKNYQKVLDYTDNAYILEQSRFIAYTILIDGIFFGYERQLGNKITLQQLPYKYCRSNFKINGIHAVEFDLRFFDQYKDTEQKIDLFNSFPPEFFELYIDYKKGNSSFWVMLNPTFARCHKLTDNQTPMFSAVFPELINLKEYKEIDKSKDKMDLYRLLVQRLPTDKTSGLPLLKLPEAQALHSNAKKMISQEGIDVLTTPLQVDSISLQEKGQTLRDNIDRATNNVYNSTGTSKIIFNSGSDGGSIGLNGSIKTDEALMIDLLAQYSHWYENRFSNLVSNVKHGFEMFMPKHTIFNIDEMFTMYKDAATLGYSKLLVALSQGLKQTTFMNLVALESDLKLVDKLVPLQSSHTQSDTTVKPGAPEKKESKLSSKGLEQKNTQSNKNRAK